MKSTHLLSLALLLTLTACDKEKPFDASGAFEAEEFVISAEATGTLLALDIEEGENLQAGQTIGYVDSTQLYLKKKQLEAQIVALQAKQPDIPTQLATLQEQLKTAEKEKQRITNLVNSGAATQKQLDDINANIDVLKKQIDAQRSTLGISSASIVKETDLLQIQIEQLNDQLSKCTIHNPVNGTVLARYAKSHEMIAAGKPLYKIADVSTMILRVYISGDQLPLVKLDQAVRVFTDDGNGGLKETKGTITWISDKAEFTPKTIQTKDERANLVYAVKIKVVNDGSYKIGMYGEVNFQ